MHGLNTTSKLVKPLIPLLKKCGGVSHKTPKEKATLRKAQMKIFHDIRKGDEYVDKLVKTGCFEPSISAVRKVPKTYASRYFPVEIKKYIEGTAKYQLTYHCDVHGRDVKIIFALFTEGELGNIEKYNRSARFIYTWLYICGNYSLRRCSNKLDIFIYFTPFTKQMPDSRTTILGASHVNTAFTHICRPHGEIVLYREEEWGKVFIHETFHSFGLDFGDFDCDNVTKRLFGIFPVKSEFHLTETYTETWSRILHTAFVSYFSLKTKTDMKSFIINMDMGLELERLFSLQQLIRVLEFMGLQYGDLYKRCDTCQMLRQNMYQEDTHVLAYYVITGIFMNDYSEFLSWCMPDDENTYKCDATPQNMYKFDATPQNMYKFLALIESQHNCDFLTDSIACVMEHLIGKKRFVSNTMRMSMLEWK